jgi:hydroxyethylthiazole kinase-like uncharacterized protein yjeF
MFQKLFTAKQIKQIDLESIKKQQITSDALMERAATRLFEKMQKEISDKQKIVVFCGVGNNGGDGLVLARLFYQNNYDVKCIIVPFSNNTSADFDTNLHRLMALDVPVNIFDENLKPFSKKYLIVDAVFGTGLSRQASGLAQKAIAIINRSRAKVVSVDMPSGLYADKSNNIIDTVVHASMVYTFQFPKISFFYPENALFIQDYEVIDIGLSKSVIKKMPTNTFLLNSKVKNILHKRSKFAYKNSFGHALIVGGSYGMTGATVLATKAAMRIGAGLVTAYVPQSAYGILQTAIPEAMVLTDKNRKKITKIKQIKLYDAIGIGMGMGTHPKTVKAFERFLKKQQKPILIDADALNILAKNKHLFKYIPKNSILTPHVGEFKSLVGTWKNESEKWQKLQNLARKHKLIVVLKGAYTHISDGAFYYINSIANSALATAGSGDVLSGVITGLLAQNYQPMEAALLGVYLHAETAEKYTKQKQAYTMIATDIIENL